VAAAAGVSAAAAAATAAKAVAAAEDELVQFRRRGEPPPAPGCAFVVFKDPLTARRAGPTLTCFFSWHVRIVQVFLGCVYLHLASELVNMSMKEG
jgi:hypothetical protein